MAQNLPSITGNHLKDKILLNIASSVKSSTEVLPLLSESRRYRNRAIQEMEERKLLKKNGNKGASLRLSKEGVELLRKTDPRLYDFYMRYSSSNKPGGTQAHLASYERASIVHAVLSEGGVLIGPQKPALSELQERGAQKLTSRTAAFYQNKEIRFGNEQRKSRAYAGSHTSVGTLLSRGFQGLVYYLSDKQTEIHPNIERESNIRVIQLGREVYSDLPFENPKLSLVLAESEDAILNSIKNQSSSNKKVKLLGEAMISKRVTGTEFLAIPKGKSGISLLHLITSYNEKEIMSVCFSQAEQETAFQERKGDAVIQASLGTKLYCYQFINCNINKLYKIKETHEDLSEVGIVCLEEQVNFLCNFFDVFDNSNTKLKLRILDFNSLRAALWRSKEMEQR